MASHARLISRWKNLKQPILQFLTCPLCNSSNEKVKYKQFLAIDMFEAGILERYQCPDCDLIFGDLRFLGFTPDQVSDDYSDLYSYYKEGDSTDYILEILHDLKLNKEACILDYACGKWNKVVENMSNEGYNIFGFDRYVKNNHPRIFDNIDDKLFDIIYTNNFVEHVIDPIKDFKIILSHLSNNGILIMISDCWDEYRVEFTHYHTFFFCGRSLNILCRELEIEHIESRQYNDVKVKIFRKLT